MDRDAREHALRIKQERNTHIQELAFTIAIAVCVVVVALVVGFLIWQNIEDEPDPIPHNLVAGTSISCVVDES